MKTKRILALLLTGVLALGMVACKSKGSEGKEDNGSKSESSSKADKKSSSFDYTIEIAGKEYNFPMTYEEFTSYGWAMSDPEYEETIMETHIFQPDTSGTISSSDYHSYFHNGDIIGVQAFFCNPDKNKEAALKDCLVSGIVLEPDGGRRSEFPAGSVELSKGIKIGESTFDEVIAAYGESQFGTNTPLIYGENYMSQGLYLDFDSQNILVSIKYFKNPA